MISAISERCFKIWMVIAFLLLIPCFQASSGAGNIHTKEKFAWSENTGWINMGPINTDFPVSVHDTYLTGYAWGEKIGWIKLSASQEGPLNSTSYSNDSNSDWGVNMASNGSLTGFAWSETSGWIKFNPALSGDPVWLNKDTGIFEGYAWGENIGYIHFKGMAENGDSYTLNTPRISINDPVIEEDEGSVKFTVTMSSKTLRDVIISYETSDGSDNSSQAKATNGIDYSGPTGTERIYAGTTSQTISIPVVNDYQQEPAEYFTLHIYQTTNASIQDSKGVAKILDDDGHTLTFKVGEHGAITTKTGTSVNGYAYSQIDGYAQKSLSVDHESNLVVSLNPDPGYKVTSIVQNGTEVLYDEVNNQFTISKIREDYLLEFNFVDTTFNISLEQNIDNGSCSITDSLTNIQYNDTRTVKCIGNTNYHLTNLNVCGNTVAQAINQQSYEHTFHVTNNCSIEVDFAIDSYSILAVVASGEGSITAVENFSSAYVDANDHLNVTVEHNMRPKVRIAPNGYHHIKDIQLNGQSIYKDCNFDGTSCEYLFDPVQSNYTLTATFDGNAYTLGMIAGAGGYISYTDNSGNWIDIHSNAFIPVPYKSSRTIKVHTNNNDLYIADINIDGKSLTRVSARPYEYNFTEISAHHVIHAQFSHILVTKSDQLGGFKPSNGNVANNVNDALSLAKNKSASLSENPIIAVDPGVYEPVIFFEQALIMYAIKGPETTIIDANKETSCFIFEDISAPVKVSGFTLKNGLYQNGGGIRIKNAEPEIIDCRIINNEATNYGGGIYISIDKELTDMIEPRLSRLYIRGNIAGVLGGGVYSGSNSGTARPRIYQSIIRKNSAGQYGGGIFVDGESANSMSDLRLASTWIVENESYSDGAGIYIDDNAKADIYTTTISNNNYKDGFGGGIFAKTGAGYTSTVNVEKSILWNNNHEMNIDGNSELVNVTYSTIKGGSNENNNNAYDPSFEDVLIGDYHLKDNSLLKNKGGLSVKTTDSMYLKDIDGYSRKTGDAIDIGGDEWNNLIPNVDFSANNTSGYSPLTVAFTNNTSGQTTLHIWEFGDGNTSNDLNPIHIYNQPGIYTVQLTVFDSNGYSATRSRYDYIVVADTEQDVVADFIAGPSDLTLNDETDVIGVTGYKPLSVKFTNLTRPETITAPYNYTCSWQWNFGNGQESTEKSPLVQFTNSGTFTVKLTVLVQGENGETIQKTKTRYNYIRVIDPEPKADFEIVPPECIKDGSDNCTVTVYDRSTSQNEIGEWHWDCGTDAVVKEITSNDNSPQTCQYMNYKLDSIKISLTVDRTDTKTKDLYFHDLSSKSVNTGESIQSAIDLIDDKTGENTILISAGTYIGNLDLKGKNLRLKAQSGDEQKVIIEPTDTSDSIIKIIKGETVILDGLVIQKNNGTVKYGGGILVDNSNLVLKNSIVKMNHATIAGGGIAFLNNSKGVIENSIIGGTATSDKNSAPYGGGLACLYDSSPMIVGNTYIGKNEATINGGGIYAYGGSNPMIMNTTIISNYATDGKGGGIYASQSEPYIAFTTIQINEADLGGGIYWNHSNFPVIRHSHIIENSVSNSGGGIYANKTVSPQILNVLIAGNTADINGSGSYLNAVSSANYLFSTIANNTATSGTGSGIYGLSLSPGLIMKNSILKNNGGDEMVILYSEPARIYNTAINQADYQGDTIISTDPKFKVYGTSSPNYQLDKGSPCQDAASDSSLIIKDLSGNDRKIGDASDLGVYESNMWPVHIVCDAYGKVMDSNNNTIQSGNYAAIADKGSAAFTVEPFVGYTITDVLLNNVSVLPVMTSNGNQMTYTITNAQKKYTLQANFKRYSVTVAIHYVEDTNGSTTNPVETSLTMTAETETGTKKWLLPGTSPFYIDIYHGSEIKLTAVPGIETQSPNFSGGSPIDGQDYSQLFSNISESTNITVTAKLKLFDITIKKDTEGEGQGSIDPYGTTTTQVKYGESITLKAIPLESSKFSGWTGFKQSNDAEITIDNIRENFDIIGRFDLKDINVRIKRIGNYGKITGYLNGTAIPGLDSLVDDHIEGYQVPGIIYNNDLELKAQKMNSWKFDKWEWITINASVESNTYSSKESSYKWEDMNADAYEITGYFSLDVRTLTIAQQAETHGSGTILVDQTARSLPITLTYAYGTSISLEAIADTYSSTFLGWSGNESSSNSNINVLMFENKTVYVNFSLKQLAVIARLKTSYGDISPLGTNYVEFGSDITFALNPSGQDAYLSDIIIDDQSMIDELGQITTYSFTNVTKAHSIEAVFSQIIRVGEGESIQGKISNSMDGDTILVSPGVYRENINFNGKTVHLKAETPYTAIIDGKHLMNTIRFVNDEPRRAKLSGFVIRNGNARTGGGIYIDNASPTIENCRIEDNAAELFGGGLYISGASASPLLISTTVQHNHSNGSGGGIYCYKSTPILSQSTITKNETQLNGGALYASDNANPNLLNMLIYDNFARYNGGGLAVKNASILVKHCTVSDNNAGEGIALHVENVQAPNQVVVQNSILWQTDELAYHVIASDNNSDIQVTGSNIFQKSGTYPGNGNVNGNPLFVDPLTQNYQIKTSSPCCNKGLDLGSNALTVDHEGFPRPYESEVDMGAFEFNDSVKHIDFYASTLSGYPGMTVQFIGYAFTGLRTYTENEYLWEFGNAAIPSSAIGREQTVVFNSLNTNKSDQFVVRLTVDGVTKEKVVLVKDTPTASFVASSTGGYAPLQVKFSDTSKSSHTITSWRWSFGDTIQSLEQNPTHIYERAGEEPYMVKLTVTDENNNSDTCTKYYYITVLDTNPKVDFIVSRTIGNSPLTVQFFDTTNSYQALESWSWNFGDGESSSNQNPVHTYYSEGDYTIQLTVKDSNGSYLESKEKLIHVINTAKVLTVSKSSRKRSGEYSSIQAAIENAKSGDVIEVDDGTYTENISFNGKNIKVYSKNGPQDTTIEHDENTHSSVVTFNDHENFGAILQGFTIIGGKAPYGGGILIANSASPSITNCIIKNCTAEKSGGGIAVMGNNTKPSISGVTVNDNSATSGAGIACLDRAHLILHNLNINNNVANDSGGGIYVFADATIHSKNVIVQDNEAANYGGGVFLNQTRTTLRSMTIKHNDAEYGSGLAIRANVSTLIDRCRITNQLSANKGGGIYVWSSDSPEIRNSFITLNTANEGGGIYFYNVTTPLIHFTTLAANEAHANEGEAIHVFSDQPDIYPMVNVRNSILWNGGHEIKTEPENNVMVTWSDIATPEVQTGIDWLDYTGNISSNPLFTNDYNYYLKQGSPCKNIASSENAPNADYDGDTRPLGTGYDMGADEATNVPPVAVASTVVVLEDTPTEVTLIAMDEDGDSLSYQIFESPQNGELVGIGNVREYRPGKNYNGKDSITFKVNDGKHDSNIAKLTINVDPVNDPPEFTIDTKIEVYENSGITRIDNWAKNINCGAGGHSSESSQTLDFYISSITNPGFFTNEPVVSREGTITFTIAEDKIGTSQITVELHDNGYTANNGQDFSSKIFDIVIQDINDPPTFSVNPSYQSFTACEDAPTVERKGYVENISPGSIYEKDQSVWFVVSVENPELFQQQPAITSEGDNLSIGTLTFVPAPNMNGSTTMTIYLKDNGCPDTGCTAGRDISEPHRTTIQIIPVNDRPDFTSGGDVHADEDSGETIKVSWVKNPIKGPSNESSQNLTYILSSDAPKLFQSGPSISSTGDLSFTPAPDMHGVATVSVQVRDNGGTAQCDANCIGVDTSYMKSFMIIIDEINDPPFFDPGDRIITFQEDMGNGDKISTQWATNVSPGNNENDQTCDFHTSTEQLNMFDYGPFISSNGKLEFKLKPNVFGEANVSVYLKDSLGATSQGTVFTIKITEINDPPSFNMTSEISVLEDSGERFIGNWADNINEGPDSRIYDPPYDESGQSIHFQTSTTATGFFLINPEIDSKGTLRFQTANNVNGTAKVTVKLIDNGKSNGEDDFKESDEKEFTLTVTPVNDAPSFNFDYTYFESDKEILIDETENSNLLSYSAFAINIHEGGTNENESEQTLNFEVTTNYPDLFAIQPSIDQYGSLKFQPEPNAAGLAVVYVTLHDSGGTANNGKDTSATQTFIIKIKAINDPPEFTLGTDPIIVSEDCGFYEETGWITGISPGGGPDEAGQMLNFEITIVGGNNDQFFVQKPKIVFDNNIGNLLFEPGPDINGERDINIFLEDNLGGTSSTKTFTIRVEPKNDPPTFKLNYETLSIREDQGEKGYNMASSIDAGASDETDQTNLSFLLTVNNPDLFSVQPSMNAEGYLIFQTGENKSGDCTIKVQLNDNQAENNLSPEQTFVLSVDNVNDAPTFHIGPDQTIKEDSRVQYILNWATDINAGAPNEYYQELSFIVEATDTTLFLVQPSIRNDGMLSYTPAPDAFGSTQVRVSLKDNGGTSWGGNDTSIAQSFGITILAVNDSPSFEMSQEPVRCDEDSGLQQINSWAKKISPGSSNENTQELTFVISTNNDDLFEIMPEMDQYGHLRFKPADNAFGSAAISVYLRDNGGMDNNGINKSSVKQFSIIIDSKNDIPSFVVGEDIKVREDASNQKFTNWATQISAGADNEDQVLTFKYEIDNEHLFSTMPNISRDGTLTFTPADDENGYAQLTLWLEDDTIYGGGKLKSVQQTFRINILPVNDKPTFTVGPELTVYEDSGSHVKPEWAYDISAGANNESGQALSFHTSTDNTALFQRLPQLTPDGDLSFQLAPNKWGTATVTLTLNDTGDTVNGGQDVSNIERITIKVISVNDAPYFTIGQDQLVSEGAPLQEKTNWATNINAGPTDESDQTILFSIVVDKPQLFEIQPTITSDGKLTYKPAIDASGVATVTVNAQDNGGTANGGVNKSEEQTFTITIEGSNDPPTFVKGEDPTVLEDSGEQIFSYWATQISAGGPGEEDQSLEFVLTVNDSSLFEELPVISEEGTLSFTPKADEFGETSVEVFLKDDGQGTNMSSVKTFNITITPVNDRPSFTRGANLIIFEDRGEQVIPNWVTNIKIGPWNEEKEQTPEFQVIPEDPRFFAAGPYISENGELKYTPALNRNGDVSVRIYLKDNGGRLNGGVDTSLPQDFNITILGINDAPSFNLHGSKYSVKEDSGRQVISNWASNINTGAVDEAGQNVRFRLSHESEDMFAEQPAISSNGVLTFTPEPDASGEAKILVYLEDDGGNANGGINVSSTKEFIIDIIAINDPPTFNKGADVRVNEDSGAKVVSNWAQNISPGAPSEIGQILTFVLDVTGSEMFAYGPEISDIGTLTFTPAPDASGIAYINVTLHDDGGVDYGGDFTSDMQQFIIEIIPTNDQPTFTVGPNQDVLEGAGNQIVPKWATNISAGSEDEKDQTLQFRLETNNPGLFTREPAVNTDGTLHYELKDNISGVASVTIYLEDNGPSTPPNQNISDEKSFKINVLPVNDPPSFDKGPNKYISEDAAEQHFENWAKNISAGPSDESDQILTFSITSDNDDLFAVYPTITSTGTLIFKTKPDLNGVANVSVQLHDNGGNSNGGISSSTIQVFMITVYEVNDQPTFTKGSDLIILEDAGEQNIIGWAKDISPGPMNESDQLLTFYVTPDNTSLFAIPPEIDVTGKLTFTPKNDIFGTTLVSVFLRDNGGVQNGGNNTSAMYQFIIRIESVNDAPSFKPGPGKTVIKSSGFNSFSNWATNIIPGPVNEASQTLEFITATSGDNIFTQDPSVSPTGTLSFIVAGGTFGSATVSLYLKDDGGTLNGGNNRTDTITFNISVIDANAPPFFTKGLNQSVPEDCGEIRVTNWATGIDAGAPDETAQTVTFHVSSDNDDLFSSKPQISSEGELTFTPAPNLYGDANVSVYLTDDGGTTNGGDDTSETQEFQIEVLSVNDKPEFRMENEYICKEDGPEQYHHKWAYDIKAGPENEKSQALFFNVTTQQPQMFQQAPTIDPSGTLIFQVASNVNGNAIVTVQLQDDGGTLNGGNDLSNDVHFTINITPVNDPPVNTSLPWISGTPTIGNTLTGHIGSWNDNIDTTPGQLTYLLQWQGAYNATEPNPADILGESQKFFSIDSNTPPYIRLEVTTWDDGEGSPNSLSTIAYSRYIGIGSDPADIDNNGKVDLADVVLSIQALSGIALEKPIIGGDINGDGQLGLADVIYIMVLLSE